MFAAAHNTDAKRLDVAEIAKLVRAEIKAQTGKALPAGLRCTVRISRYSMGCSLDVSVVAAPFNTLNAARVVFEAEQPHVVPPAGMGRLSRQACQLVTALDAIVSQYHRDDSDLQADVYNVNFSKHVGFAWELERADRAERLAEIAAAAA